MGIGELMTSQMQEEIEEQTKGSVMDQIQRAQYIASQKKSIRMAQDRLQKTIKKRDTNRRKNKAARKARRKNR